MSESASYAVWTDEDFDEHYSMAAAVDAIRRAIRAHGKGDLVAPPRFSLEVDDGSLVFTAGAETAEINAMGFRVYGTIPDSPDDYQLVAVFDSRTGHFRGIIIGTRVGAVRTGAIGGVAIDLLASDSVERIGILGSGRQARTQLEAAVEVRDPKRIVVYSPTAEHRETFATEMQRTLGLAIEPVESAREAVRGADVLITATSSRAPILDRDWIEPGVHINAVGPKFRDVHELPPELGERLDVVATDSLAQLDGYAERGIGFFLEDTPLADDILELADLMCGTTDGRKDEDDITLFSSVGLAGTEVVVAHDALTNGGGVGG